LLLFSVLVFSLTAAPVACGPTGEEEAVANAGRVNLLVRRGEADIYVHPDSVKICRNPTMSCPGEVLWVVVGGGLNEGEVLYIEGKTEQCFEGEPFEIHYPNNSQPSGPSTCEPGTDWQYKIWVTKNGQTIASVDPEVIIRGGGNP
jgi:hypothetical protein